MLQPEMDPNPHLKGVHEGEEVPSVGLGDDAPRCLESELHNALVPVRGCQVEHAEDVLPARLDVGRLKHKTC